jgi:tetratricopeptide (TPR) repeat protein
MSDSTRRGAPKGRSTPGNHALDRMEGQRHTAESSDRWQIPMQASLWLIKTGGRVSGPFSTEEVIEQIRTRTIVPLDEVIAPQGRWLYIRDQTVFTEAVAEARDDQAQVREDTEVHITSSTHQSYDETREDDHLSFDRVGSARGTPFGVDLNKSNMESSHAELVGTSSRTRLPFSHSEVLDADFEDQPRSAHRASRFGPSFDEKAKIRLLALGVGALVLASAFVIFLRGQSQSENFLDGNGQPRFEDTTTIALGDAAWMNGEWANSLTAYRQAAIAMESDAERAVKTAALMLRLEGATVEAKRLLNRVADRISSEPGYQSPNPNSNQPRKEQSKEEIAHLDLGFGLVAVYEQDFGEARRRFLTAASSESDNKPQIAAPSSAQSIVAFNLGAVAFLQNSWLDSAEQFRVLGKQSIARFMLARTLVRPNMSVGKANNEAQEILERLIRDRGDFQQEALLILAWIKASTGKIDEASIHARALFEVDPWATENHYRDPRLAIEVASWKSMMFECRSLAKALPNPLRTSVIGFCLSKSEGEDEAHRLVGNELARSIQDARLQTVNAFLLVQADRYEEARSALRLALKGTESPLMAHLIEAKICSQMGDVKCAEKKWGELARGEAPPLVALAELAQIHLSRGEQSQGRELLGRAERVSSSYLPLIHLKKLSESGGREK